MFRPADARIFSVDLPQEKYPKPEQCVAFYDNVLDELRALPGVSAAGAASTPPLGCEWGQFFVTKDGPSRAGDNKNPIRLQVVVTPGYFEAIGMSLLSGRQFDSDDVDSDRLSQLPKSAAFIWKRER
jgi:putative ABC transport system permease protein